jgi:hypothetical protein
MYRDSVRLCRRVLLERWPVLVASFDTFLGTFHLALDFSAQAGKTTVLLGESGSTP